jgi:hypothetical protein
MKTQISILVKNESLLSRFMSLLWFINIFKRMSVNVWIDDDSVAPQVLKARKEPYVFDVEPGYHAILVTDPRAKGKQAFNAITGALVGGSFGLAAGDGFSGAMMGADAFGGGSQVHDSGVECTLNEGDILKLSVKPKHNGSVKIKILKK